MAILPINNKLIFNHIKNYFIDYYAGKITQSCDKDCPDECDGNHGNYELPINYPKLFNDEK